MDWNQIVAANVRLRRSELNMTQERLALDSNLDLTYIGGIERGRRNPTVKALGQIATALGVTPADLLRPQAFER